ncbi:YeiH family protein [Natronobeatus ordinarius]|uniref:YeiH family protein n=1 Tax=Natronobeatus ordinarius TaxID=2963433 RepID=UPI0020CC56CD|nr:putative sulfate exporter family transporter [Natronobeatus ordinarius]
MRAVSLLPGLALLVAGAIVARTLAPIVGVHHLLLAIAIGFVVANASGVPAVAASGVDTHSRWLAAGIVLMGASVTLETLLEAGGVVLAVVLGVCGFTLLVVEGLARNVFGLNDRLGSLLAAGASICGVSAVVAVAGAVDARQEQIAYAAATVLLFDAITIVVFPIVGDLLGLSGMVFGIWAGVSMFSTGPVVAVGFAHSEVAGQWATVTKLARNALIGVVVVGYATYYARTNAAGQGPPSIRTLWEGFPTFVLGFLVFVLAASVGVFSPAQHAAIERAYDWLFLLAFVGLGTEIRLAALRRTGLTPALVVLLALALVSTLSLAVLTVLF